MPSFVIDTDIEGTYLKQLTLTDVPAMFEAIDANREHLSQFGDTTAAKYPTRESVAESITNPTNPEKIRMGIWHGPKFVGSVNLTPVDKDTDSDEIGYWLDGRETGHGYATAAVRTMARFALENGTRNLIAQVERYNYKSVAVLERVGFTQTARDGSRRILRLLGDIK